MIVKLEQMQQTDSKLKRHRQTVEKIDIGQSKTDI